MEQIGLLLICIAGISEGIMDKIQFHFHKSIFKNFNNHLFWNPDLSWRNKWKNGNPEQGERFIFSSTLLVGLTDAWHMFKSVRTFSLFLGMFLLTYGTHIILLFLIARTIFGVSFYLTYNYTNLK
jgi:hypothetical protein